MIKPRFESTDLLDADRPEKVPEILNNTAEAMRKIRDYYPDINPSSQYRWNAIAGELKATAERIEQKLKELG